MVLNLLSFHTALLVLSIKKSFGLKLSLSIKVSPMLVLRGFKKDLNSNSDATLGQVRVSDSHQPICIPANSAKVVSW